MLQPAAVALDVDLRVLAGSSTDSAALVVPGTSVGEESSLADLTTFADVVDVVTFDHEQVSPAHLRSLVAHGAILRPGPAALAHAQDKLVMRRRLAELGIPVPAFAVVADPGEVVATAQQAGWPVVLKTARGGYDGRGVWVVDSVTEAGEPFLAGVPVIAEEHVDYRRELSAMVARSPSGQAVAYPVVESVQRDGICVEVLAPAPGLDPDLATAAQQLALRVASELDVVGVLAVELFETDPQAYEDRLLVNELAMRPHNSGHWTIDGAVTSQFENHLRAVLDLPLGAPNAVAARTVMVNILGGELPDLHASLRHVMARDPGVKVHLYGKAVRPGRKVGHVTVTGQNTESALASLRERAWHAADCITGMIDE